MKIAIGQGLMTLGLMLAGPALGSELLWDNGAPNGSGGLNSQYETVLDDFYVPGGGWFISGAETVGIFLNPGRVVTTVDVTIWGHDYATDEPNGSDTVNLNVTNFTATPTGELWYGYEKIEIAVEFDQTFLNGQEYYWIEFDVSDQYGERIIFLDRAPVAYQPAHTRSNPYPSSLEHKDLPYSLHGTKVVVLNLPGADDITLKGLDQGRDVQTVFIPSQLGIFQRGIYQMQLIDRQPQLFRFDRDGRSRIDFPLQKRSTDPDAQPLSTPLGDDMCKNAPDLIHDFCQSFVACAAYELFCPG